MGRHGSRHWTGLAAAALFVAASAPAFGHDGHNHAAKDRRAVAPEDVSAVAREGGGARWGGNYFPNVPLVTHEGKSVRFFDDLIKDKVVVINFVYTNCPDSCPLETARLVNLQRILGDRVGRDVFMYSISIDPARDTPEVLKRYAEKFKIGPGWLFLTGKEDDITLLRRKLGVYQEAIEEDTSDHSLSLVIGNQSTGQWMKRSPFENSYFLAEQVGSWLTSWKKGAINKNDYADAPKIRQTALGESLFRGRCAACHTIGGGDVRDVARGNLGPDLLGVTATRERAWLVRWLTNPEKMLAEKDPIALALYAQYDEMLMPNFGLNEREINALIEYMDAESRRARETQRAAAVAR